MSGPYVVGATETGNPNVLQFHTRTPITSWVAERGIKNATCDDWCPVLQCLLKIDGVLTVEVNPFCAAVEKGMMFEWREIAPEVMKILVWWHGAMTGEEPRERIQENVAREQAPVAPEPEGQPMYGWTGLYIWPDSERLTDNS